MVRIGAAILLAALSLPLAVARAEPPTLRPEVLASTRLDTTNRETIVTLPVALKTADGCVHATFFQLSHVRPAGDGPFPLVVLHHGRDGERDYPSRYRPTGAHVSYFLRRGFAVFTPTRVGYGGLGTRLDPERGAPGSGCDTISVEPQITAVEAQTRAAVAYARTLGWVDTSRVVLAGQSVGGYTSIAAAARGIDGVVAVLNFSGGVGANKKGPPYCPERLTRTFQTAGKTLRVPTLWVYGDNDPYWGPKLARSWHKSFVDAGGTATYIGVPYVPVDGHAPIAMAAHAWRPQADALLAPFGIKRPVAVGAPPATSFARLGDFAMLRSTNYDVVPSYQRFLNSDYPRAFAFSPNGAWAWRSGTDDPLKAALVTCEKTAKRACKLYAVDDDIVWVP